MAIQKVTPEIENTIPCLDIHSYRGFIRILNKFPMNKEEGNFSVIYNIQVNCKTKIETKLSLQNVIEYL